MQRVVSVLAYLACVGHGKRLQRPMEHLHKRLPLEAAKFPSLQSFAEANQLDGQGRLHPLETVASFFFALNPLAAFNRNLVAALAPASATLANRSPAPRGGPCMAVATVMPTDSGVKICDFTRKAIDGQNEEHDILLRAARGEVTKRPPVWLMRQAGRYMAAFREYSEKYAFRQRSETPDMAVKLSLQPWHAFGTDGVIMFSDILTPLPAFGIEFDVVRGKGPVIKTPMDTAEDLAKVTLPKLEDFEEKMPFIQEILGSLRKETEGATTLLGFVGAPWTLAAYSMEGGGTKNALKSHKLMMHEPEAVEQFLRKLAEGIATYAAYQVSCGAQVIQIFESWAHHISPETFEKFAKPYAKLCIELIKKKCPDTPVIYFANGGSSYLELQTDMGSDMLCIDWGVDMEVAREIIGKEAGVSGNVDPRILFGTEEQIRKAVSACAAKAEGAPFVLNVGHGVMQGTPEENVGIFVDQARKSYY